MIQQHGLVYVFNLTTKENNIYFYPYFGGQGECFEHIAYMQSTQLFTLVTQYHFFEWSTSPQKKEASAGIYNLFLTLQKWRVVLWTYLFPK